MKPEWCEVHGEHRGEECPKCDDELFSIQEGQAASFNEGYQQGIRECVEALMSPESPDGSLGSALWLEHKMITNAPTTAKDDT